MFMEFLTLGIGLILAALANVVVGSATAYVNGKFNPKTLKRGVVKALAVAVALGCLALAGYLNPTIVGIVIGDASMNLYSAVKTTMTAGIIAYAGMTLNQVVKTMRLKLLKKQNIK